MKLDFIIFFRYFLVGFGCLNCWASLFLFVWVFGIWFVCKVLVSFGLCFEKFGFGRRN